MLRNLVTLIDLNDNQLGTCEKAEAHKKGLLHRAFSVFLFNGNKMLIQKRAATKYHTPNLWTNACCSHPQLNEDVVLSAELRCKEELGITKPLTLKEVFNFVYFYKFREDLIEYELDHVLMGEYNGEVVLDPEEASEVMWIEIDDLLKWVQEKPQEFTPWFIICLTKVIDKYKNR